MNNKVNYTGNVKFRLKIGSEYYDATMVHNNGTALLFKSLCQYLCGYGSSDLIPSRLDLLKSATSTFDIEESVLNPLPTFIYPTYKEDASLGWIAEFTTTVTSEMLQEDMSESTNYHRFALKSNLGYLAFVDVELEFLQTIQSNIALEVCWQMYFSNTAEG